MKTAHARWSDTSAAALAEQIRIWRGMTGAQRVKLTFEMSEMMRALAAARLRSEHPDWTEMDVRRELLRYAFLSAGVELPPPLR